MSKKTDTGVAKPISEANTEEIGEGNHAADRRYREATEKFIAEGKVEGAAREAQRAVEDEREGRELRQAEERGRAPAGRQPDAAKTAPARH